MRGIIGPPKERKVTLVRGNWLDVRGNHTLAPTVHHGEPSECCRKEATR